MGQQPINQVVAGNSWWQLTAKLQAENKIESLLKCWEHKVPQHRKLTTLTNPKQDIVNELVLAHRLALTINMDPKAGLL